MYYFWHLSCFFKKMNNFKLSEFCHVNYNVIYYDNIYIWMMLTTTTFFLNYLNSELFLYCFWFAFLKHLFMRFGLLALNELNKNILGCHTSTTLCCLYQCCLKKRCWPRSRDETIWIPNYRKNHCGGRVDFPTIWFSI